MQLKSLLTFGLVGFAAAAPAVASPEAIGDLTKAMQTIATSLNTFDTAVVALSAGADPKAATAELTAKANAVKDTIKAQTTAVETSTGEISLIQATQLLSSSTTLTNAAKKAIDDLISKKDIIVKAGQQALTLQQLQDQKDSTTKFVEALQKKLPSAVAGIAGSQAKQATDAIQKGIDAYKQ